MACALTQGYLRDCDNGYGGVNTIYVMEFDNATAITAAAGVVTAITKATGKLFRKYELIAHTAEGDEAMSHSREMGTNEVKQTLKFPINKMTVAVRNELMLLRQQRLLFVFIDENGLGWLYGKDYGLTMATTAAKTGVKLADRNGYELVFEGEEKELAYNVDATTITSLTVAGV
jgi:hypothetical protein